MTMNTDNNNNRMLMSPPPRHRRHHRKPLGNIQKENDIIPSSSNDDDDNNIKKTQEMISSSVLSSPEMKLLPIIRTPMKPSLAVPVAVAALNYNRNNNTPKNQKTGGNGNIGYRTPNAGKILSPLPLQSRRFKMKTPAQKKKIITIDNMEECFHLLCNIDDDQENKNDENNNSAAGNGRYYQQLKSKHHLALMMNDSDDNDDDDDDVRDDDDDNNSNDSNNTIGGSNNVDVKAVHEDSNDDDDDDDESIEWQRSIDDVEFVCKLGEGGTAQVYQVREKDTGTMFALKVQKESDDAMCEMDLHIPLLHPHICRMIDYFYCDTKPFVQQCLMDVQFDKTQHQQQLAEEEEDESCTTRYLCSILELCNSGSLHDVIDRFCTMPESIAAQYMKDAIDALDYLHKDEMIIHCDIKPGNWLVTGEGPDTIGTIKLADFGMAVPFNEREIVGGSPVYMSPEHLLAWRDMTDEIDYRSDIYSMGVVLYEMLMGYLPYEVLEANTTNDDDEDADDQDDDNDSEYGDSGYPVLDLRKLNDITSDKPFYIPPPIFMEDISDEAQDLIMRLMEPSLSKRITLEEVKNHEWFQKVLL